MHFDYDDKPNHIIDERPSFLDLVAIYNNIKNVESCLNALAEEGDIIQRATDLLVAVEELKNITLSTCYIDP